MTGSGIKVLLTTDGTYPCYTGGVSVWCDQLVRHSPDVTFRIFALAYSPSQRSVYSMPPNVEACQILPLWGVREAGWANGLFSQTYRRKVRTTYASLRKEFLCPFREAVRGLVAPGDPESLAESMAMLNEYFQHCDYHKAMTSPEAWDAFLEISGRYFPEKLDLAGATTCMRWLHRYLAVLSFPTQEVDIVHATDTADARPTYVEIRRVESITGPAEGDRPSFGSMPAYPNPVKDGVLLEAVLEGTPADKAGIKGGDVLVKFGDNKVTVLEDFEGALRQYKPGDKVKVTIRRETELIEAEVTLARRRAMP